MKQKIKRPPKRASAAGQACLPNSQKVHLKKGPSTKPTPPAAAPELRATSRKPQAVPAMPVTRTVAAQNHAQRVAAHRAQLDAIHDAYRESTANAFSEPAPLAEKQKRIRKNMRQLAKALGDWHCTALELLDEGQQAALLQMLPDFKGGRWLN